MLRTLREAFLIVLAGTALGLGLNAISPKGISLARNYFPKVVSSAAVSQAPGTDPLANGEGPPAPPSREDAAREASERLAAKGLSLAAHDQVRELYEDPRYAQGLVVFVDARNEAQFQEGHIPGAYLFDHYRMDQYVAEVLPVCQIAEEVVVYCTGGSCEDSEFAAIDLIELGVSNDPLLIYGGGMTEWKERGMPIELGMRLSGNIVNH